MAIRNRPVALIRHAYHGIPAAMPFDQVVELPRIGSMQADAAVRGGTPETTDIVGAMYRIATIVKH